MLVYTIIFLLSSTVGLFAGPVVGVVAAVAIGAASSAGIISATTALVLGLVVNLATTFLGKKKPKQNPAQVQQGITTTVRDSAATHKIIYGRARVGGAFLMMESTGSDNKYLNLIVAHAGHQIESYEHILFGDTIVVTNGVKTESSFKNKFEKSELLGLTTQAADSNLKSWISEWNDNDTLSGIAYTAYRLEYDPDIYTNGIPTINVIAKGALLYDPRDFSTSYSTNPALALRHYLINFAEVDAGDLDDDSFSDAANICDETITYASGATGARYSINGVIDTGDSHDENIGKILQTMAGKLVYTEGKFKVWAGAYTTPVVTFTEDDFTGPLTIATAADRKDKFNTVKTVIVKGPTDSGVVDGTYGSVEDAQVITNDAALSDDNNKKLYRDLDLFLVDNKDQAVVLANIFLKESRADVSVKAAVSLKHLGLSPGDIIGITYPRFGWTNKAFQILNWTFSVDPSSTDLLGIELDLKEIDSTIYDETYESLVLSSENSSSLINSNTVVAPSELTLTSGSAELIVTGGGAVLPRIKVQWTQPNDAFSNELIVEYKRSSESTWTAQKVVGGTTSTFIGPVKDQTFYDVRIRSINIYGAKSEYLTQTGFYVNAKAEAPAPPENFRINQKSDGTRVFSWTPPTNKPADLAGYEIRYGSSSAVTWDNMTKLHQGVLTASPYETVALIAGTYGFRLRSVDTTGNYSEQGLVIDATLAAVGDTNIVATEDARESGWSGTITNGYEDAKGDLIATDQNDWSDLSGSTWATFTTWHQNANNLIYQYDDIDLGSVVDFTPFATVDSSGTATVEVAYSDDDITYSSYASVDGSSYTGRYVRYRVTISGDTPTLREFYMYISSNTQEEYINDLDTSTISSPTGDFRAPITGNYTVIRQVFVALQNVGAGWSWEVIDKNAASGPRIKIYNNTGILADATVDIHIIGY